MQTLSLREILGIFSTFSDDSEHFLFGEKPWLPPKVSFHESCFTILTIFDKTNFFPCSMTVQAKCNHVKLSTISFIKQLLFGALIFLARRTPEHCLRFCEQSESCSSCFNLFDFPSFDKAVCESAQ